MQYKKLIKSEIEFTSTFRQVSQAYEELAVMKMKKVRGGVLKMRDYIEKLSQVFYDVKHAYELYIKQLKKSQKPGSQQKKIKLPVPFSFPKPSKSAAIFLSANAKLYGNIIEEVFELFTKEALKPETDLIIVGRIGRRLYEEKKIGHPYFYFDLPDTNVTLELLKPILFHLQKYDRIQVYFGKFEKVGDQEATFSNVSGEQPFLDSSSASQQKAAATSQVKFLFEPSIKDILHFFKTMVSASLFRQAVYESELARLGSRIMVLEEAQTNVLVKLQKLRSQERKIRVRQDNIKQLERISGIGFWGR